MLTLVEELETGLDEDEELVVVTIELVVLFAAKYAKYAAPDTRITMTTTTATTSAALPIPFFEVFNFVR